MIIRVFTAGAYQGIHVDKIEPHCEPSCIVLICTSQPNLDQNSGTSASLFERCHHQIICAGINLKVFYPPQKKNLGL